MYGRKKGKQFGSDEELAGRFESSLKCLPGTKVADLTSIFFSGATDESIVASNCGQCAILSTC